MCDLLKKCVFSNWQKNSFGCTLELAFINCYVYNLYLALLNLSGKHSPPPVTFPREISTECFEILTSHIFNVEVKCCVMYFTITFLF